MGDEPQVWVPDQVLGGFERRDISLRDDGDRPVATLVRRSPEGPDRAARAVLYLHGFSDYFFQAHLAEAYREHGYAFVALELRRYGRSLRPGQVPFACRSLDDYFEEITAAIDLMVGEAAPPSSSTPTAPGG